MGVSVVIGGQFGSEGKGKVARYYARKYQASSVIRVGGINSGHTVIDGNGQPVIFRTLPTAAIDHEVNCILPAGSYFDVDMLFEEIKMAGISPSKVKIHPNAAIITPEQVQMERDAELTRRLGSTASGTGACVAMRVMRDKRFVRAKDVKRLEPFICDVDGFLRQELLHGHEVLIEGTQGFGLSNLHSTYFPKATSRDTSAAGFLSEVGLSPFDVSHIIMVIRSYPIRVAGDSGELPREISWDRVTDMAGWDTPIKEYTSVTKKERRVGMFDPDVVLRAIRANRPDQIVLNHLDYIPGPSEAVGEERTAFVEKIQKILRNKITHVGLGPNSICSI